MPGFELLHASKAGCSRSVAFTTGASARLQMVIRPVRPYLLLLRATQDCYIRQGGSDVTAATTDLLLIAGVTWPLLVDSIDNAYIAARGASASGTLYSTFGSDTSSALCPAAASELGSGTALFAGGWDSGNTAIADTTKFDFAAATMEAGTDLTTAKSGSVGLGTSTTGYVTYGGARSGGNHTVRKYVYATDTVTSVNVASGITDEDVSGAGNSTLGCIVGNINEKLTYASDTQVQGTSFNNGQQRNAGVGPSTHGIFRTAGDDTTEKYTYASDTVANATALSYSADSDRACGTDTLGVFAGGLDSGTALAVTSTTEYTYSGDTAEAGTALSAARYSEGATSNDTAGIFAGGCNDSSQALDTSDTYIFSTGTVAAAATLTTAAGLLAATSDNYGGLQ